MAKRTKAAFEAPITRIQTWPGGEGFEYRGDLHGPAEQRTLRSVKYNGGELELFRAGTPDEWRKILTSTMAEGYVGNEIFCCDSSLVDELLKLAGEERGDLADAFSYDELHNLYADPSDWDADQCREYANDHGLELPDVPTEDCAACDGVGAHSKNSEGAEECTVCKGSGSVPEADYEEGDWLEVAQARCHEHAQENPAEVYEWWRVSQWLCNRLKGIGEVVIDNGYGCWWGRTCTGQGVLMDGTLQRIAANFVE